MVDTFWGFGSCPGSRCLRFPSYGFLARKLNLLGIRPPAKTRVDGRKQPTNTIKPTRPDSGYSATTKCYVRDTEHWERPAMIYVVSYDLPRGPFGPSIQPFTQELERIPPAYTWWHFLERTWLIATPERIQDIDMRLRQHIQVNDRLLIFALPQGFPNINYAGWLPREAWDWIQQRQSYEWL